MFHSHYFQYYKNRDIYDSGNPYGEGGFWERHGPLKGGAQRDSETSTLFAMQGKVNAFSGITAEE